MEQANAHAPKPNRLAKPNNHQSKQHLDKALAAHFLPALAAAPNQPKSAQAALMVGQYRRWQQAQAADRNFLVGLFGNWVLDKLTVDKSAVDKQVALDS